MAIQAGLFVAVMNMNTSKLRRSDLIREAECLLLIREGFWHIDQEGHLWSVERRVANSTGEPTEVCATNPTLLGKPDTDGYLRVMLRYDSSQFACQVDRLVWRHLRGPIHPGWTIAHKNGDNGDNRIENLELVSPAEQARQTQASTRTAQSGRPKAERSVPAVHHGRPQPWGRPRQLRGEEVLKIRELLESGQKIKQLAVLFGVSSSRIYQIKSALSWKHSVERSGSASLDQQPMAR